MRKRKLVRGVGINDADYEVSPKVDGRSVQCPFYDRWNNMLRRCYSKEHLTKSPTYVGCSVCDEWIYFSNFKRWMEKQDWQGKHLDKDLLLQGSKIYSPETVVFISGGLNNFIVDRGRARGGCMIGVCYQPYKSQSMPYYAQCSDPFGNNGCYVGCYPTELEAHKAWQARKHQYALQLAELQDDPRVAKALRERYAPYKDWTQR